MLIDLPILCHEEEYDNLRNKIIKNYASKEPKILIYSIGSVSTPGISDLDFVFVFKDGSVYNLNPMDDLSRKERYIMKHNPFGLCESHWRRHFNYSIISSYNILYPNNNSCITKIPVNEIDSSLKIQIALEYILKFYISLTTQISVNIFKVRSLFLELKSFLIDYNILDNEHIALKESLTCILDLRENWHSIQNRAKYFEKSILQFYMYLEIYLKDVFTTNTIFLPHPDNIEYLVNISFSNGKPLRRFSRGIGSIIGTTGIKTNKSFKIANKFQKYHFTFPWETYTDKLSDLYKKYIFEKEMYEYNSRFLRYFLPLKSPLHIFSNE